MAFWRIPATCMYNIYVRIYIYLWLPQLPLPDLWKMLNQGLKQVSNRRETSPKLSSSESYFNHVLLVPSIELFAKKQTTIKHLVSFWNWNFPYNHLDATVKKYFSFLSPRKVLLIGDAPAAEINFQSLGSLGSLDFDAKPRHAKLRRWACRLWRLGGDQKWRKNRWFMVDKPRLEPLTKIHIFIYIYIYHTSYRMVPPAVLWMLV